MTIDGKYMSEPKVQAYISKLQAELGSAEDYIDSRNERIAELEGENYKLTEKLEEIGTAFNEQVSLVGWYEERVKDLISELEIVTKQEKECKRLLKEAVPIINNMFPEVGSCWGCANHDEANDRCKAGAFEECAEVCKWKHADEALELIGDESSGI